MSVEEAAEKDQYFTPENVAAVLVADLYGTHGGALGRSGVVIEPSLGAGAFAKALRYVVNVPIVGIDIDPHPTGVASVDDFYQGDWLVMAPGLEGAEVVSVVGNPPFSKHCGTPHIKAALRVAFGSDSPSPEQVKGRGVVAMLVPIGLLSAKKRAEWLQAIDPFVTLLYPRPRFEGPADKGEGGKQDMIWLVVGEPDNQDTRQLRWLSSQEV